jgi:predicted amidohydrolase YtcJ
MIESYTINGARANFLETETGSIEVGKWADLAVLNENILESPPENIGFNWMGGGTAKVLMTMFCGKTVYKASDLS